MRSVQSGLLFLVAAAAPGVFGARRPNPLRSYGRAVDVQDGWISASSGPAPLFKTNMLQVVGDEPAVPSPIVQVPEPIEEPEPEEPAPEEPATPATPPGPATSPEFPNDFIKSVSWSGSGCPNGPESEDPSITATIDEESDFTAFFMKAFGVSLGLDDAYGPKGQSCALVFDVEGVPAGWRFGFIDSRAEGNIYLEKGSIANFTTEIWWGDDSKPLVQNMKYWPNLDRDEPVNVRYMTTPFMLDALTMTPYASVCPAGGSTFSGKMTVKFSLSMEAGDKAAKPEPRALVDMLAVGITNRLIPC